MPSQDSLTDADRRIGLPSSVLLLALGAVLLRFLLLLGRGDYLAFDEGWYLLLARSIYTGDGYSLIGIPHVTLSPLFPLLAGAVGTVIDSWMWGGRIVAALASGLVVIPAWAVFRRLASERVALIGALLVAVIPSMAPFVVAYWIGADLWVGAEPLLHLFLYTGIALWLAARERGGAWRWAATGAAFGLAFLARPEAILTWGLLGLAALVHAGIRRSPKVLVGATVMGLAFVVVAAPYWLYVHQATGRWSLTGRGVAPLASASRVVSGSGAGAPAATIERMLWADDEAYERHLYGLDETGLRLRSDYWGVQPPPAPPPAATTAEETARAADPAPESESARATPPPVEPSAARDRRDPPPTGVLYLRALGRIIPLLLWPFIILGMVRPRRLEHRGAEAAVAAAVLGTSLAVAFLIAADARTQLFVVPLLCFYAAHGFDWLEHAIQERVTGAELRPGFITALAVGAAVVWMLGIHGQRLYRSLALGSPHHVAGEQNRAVAEELDALPGVPDGPVASWHPGIAVHADRDWRVLPHATLPEILRYTAAAGAEVLVLSAYYPPPLGIERIGTRYLVLPVPAAADTLGPGAAWQVRRERGDSIRAVGTATPMPTSPQP